MGKYNVLAFDSGNAESGLAIMSTDYELLWFGKFNNMDLLYKGVLRDAIATYNPKRAVFEKISSYGMIAGASMYETCEAIGKQKQWLADLYGMLDVEVAGITKAVVVDVKRKTYITELCGDPKAKDKNLKAYLIDRFAPNTPNYGKGTKKNPGYFYGVSADSWSAIGIAVWYVDILNDNPAHLY